MKHLILIVTCLFSLIGFSQSSEITIDAIAENDTLIFFASNNSKYVQDVTLKVTNPIALEGFVDALTVRLLPNTTDIFHRLAITGEYTYDFIYVNQFPSDLILKKDFMVDGVSLNKGIVIFDKQGCARCDQTIGYLTKNNKAYQSLNISENSFYKNLMWDVLTASGYRGQTVQTPVILVDGAVSFGHEDLSAFLMSLK